MFRKTEVKDLPQVVKIIEKAQERMRNSGLDQWQYGYPDEEIILEDIEKGISYVLEDSGKITGTGVLTFKREAAYEKMKEGNWISEEGTGYGVIHRIAVSEENIGKGTAGKLLNYMEKECIKREIYSIKVDTHENNEPMKNFLIKNGFLLCGVIYLDRGPEENSKRITFEKLLRK